MIFRELTFYTASALSNTFDWDVSDADYVSFQLVGTGWTGTLTFYGTVDGNNYETFAVENRSSTTPATRITSSTGNGIFTFDTKALKKFRIICTAFTAGTMKIIVCTGRNI